MSADSDIPPYQWLVAAFALEKLRNMPDVEASDKIILDFFKAMHPDDPGYYTWEYVINRDKSYKTSIAHKLSCEMTTHEKIALSGPWDKYTSAALRKRLKKVSDTQVPKDALEKFIFTLGKDFRENSDRIPDGAKLTDQTGVGFQTITLDGELLEIARNPKKGDVYVELEITSWKGLSIGAEHYYSKIKLWGWEPSFKVLTTVRGGRYKVGDYYGQSGHGDVVKPRMCRFGDICIRRPLTKQDLKETKARGNEDRYEGYEIGDMIDGFWTKDDAIAHGKRHYSRLFDEKTVALKIDDNS